jgi:ribonucleoside-triphosphate reductase
MCHKQCQEFAKQVLDHMRERLSDYQEQYGDLYNLEATPAESTAYRFAKHDKEDFPDIITAAEPGGEPYYTNSSHLPVRFTDDIFTALDIQDELQTKYTSGTVFHAFLGEKLPNWESAASLVRKIAENYRLPYYTISPTYSVCKNHGYLTGEHFICPTCGKPAEVYSRITGYYRPVQNWNAGKTQEYKDRRDYSFDAETENRANERYSKTEDHEGLMKDETAEIPEAFKQPILFATATCPNCRIASNYLDKAGFVYRKVLADENPETASALGIKQAPTLVLNNGTMIAGAGAIRKFAEKMEKP